MYRAIHHAHRLSTCQDLPFFILSCLTPCGIGCFLKVLPLPPTPTPHPFKERPLTVADKLAEATAPKDLNQTVKPKRGRGGQTTGDAAQVFFWIKDVSKGWGWMDGEGGDDVES